MPAFCKPEKVKTRLAYLGISNWVCIMENLSIFHFIFLVKLDWLILEFQIGCV
jgi:hypothetical protein